MHVVGVGTVLRPWTAGLSPIGPATRPTTLLGRAWFHLSPFRSSRSTFARKSVRLLRFAVPARRGAGVGVDPP